MFSSFFLGNFGFSIAYFSITGIFSAAISIGCYAMVLRETRIVQKNDAHDGASRILGVTVLYFFMLGLDNVFALSVFGLGGLVNPLFLLLGLVMIVAILWYEQRRYLLVQAVYHAKDKAYTIDPIDPLNPPKALLPLAYWPNVNCDGVLHRTDQSNTNDEPFRSNSVKVPLFIVPTQAEPFVGLLSRRLHRYIALLLLSLLFLFEYLAG
jgi:hypothetical protein